MDAIDAALFTELAKIAIRRQISFENQVTTFETQIAQQTELTDQLLAFMKLGKPRS